MDIGNMIGNYAFPIVCCVAMGYFIYKQDIDKKENRKNLQNKAFEYIEKAMDAFTENTISLQRMGDAVERLIEKVEDIKENDDANNGK